MIPLAEVPTTDGVYVIHFSAPLAHAHGYVGWSADIARRVDCSVGPVAAGGFVGVFEVPLRGLVVADVDAPRAVDGRAAPTLLAELVDTHDRPADNERPCGSRSPSPPFC